MSLHWLVTWRTHTQTDGHSLLQLRMRKWVAAPSERWCRVMSSSHGEAIHLCIYGFYVLWPGQGKQIPLSHRCTLWTTGVMFPSRYPSFQTVKQHPWLNFGNKRFTASCSPFINLSMMQFSIFSSHNTRNYCMTRNGKLPLSSNHITHSQQEIYKLSFCHIFTTRRSPEL